jgi:hypothetical protein
MSTKTAQATEGEMTSQNNLEENKRIVRAFIETAFNKHPMIATAEAVRRSCAAFPRSVGSGI